MARPNAHSAREIVAAPHLRIIDDELWERVKARQVTLRHEMTRASKGHALNRAHRRHFLLSGLLTCGACGAGYTVIAKDRYGCAGRRSKGTCTNGLTVTRRELETRVLEGLKKRLMAPELVQTFIDEYRKEATRLAGDHAKERRGLESRLAKAKRQTTGIIRSIEDGAYNAMLGARLTELEHERVRLEEQLAASTAPEPVTLHPAMAEAYARKVAALEETLNDPLVREESSEVLRSLIQRIEIHGGDDGRAALLLRGDLATLLAFAESEKQKLPGAGAPGSLLSVVAGTRNCLNLLLNGSVLVWPGVRPT